MIVLNDYGVTEDCKNLEESYGEICVKCNKCGRFDAEGEDKHDLYNSKGRRGSGERNMAP